MVRAFFLLLRMPNMADTDGASAPYKFQNNLASDLIQSEVLQVKGNSILFLGKKKDSFRKAYELLKKDTFEKLARGLKAAEVVRRDIDNALGGDRQMGIDEDAIGDSFDRPPDDS